MIKIGDKVLCRLFNTPEKKFYGDYFHVIIHNIIPEKGVKKYTAISDDGYEWTLHRKEIKKIIKKTA
jgi:hypothetical protein